MNKPWAAWSAEAQTSSLLNLSILGSCFWSHIPAHWKDPDQPPGILDTQLSLNSTVSPKSSWSGPNDIGMT